MADLVTTSFGTRKVPLTALRDALCSPAEAHFEAETDRLLSDCRVSLPRPEQARRALLRERAASTFCAVVWQVRVPAGSSFIRQIVQAGLRARLIKFIGAYAAEYLLSLGAWWLLAQAALSGRFDIAWMTAWVAMMASGLLFAYGGCRAARGSPSDLVAC
jgi:hypothetical protein